MSARDDILSGSFKTSPAAVDALRKAGGTGAEAELFASYVGYANAMWSYAAQPGGQIAKDLLDGDGTKSVACGTLREAFKLMLREDLKLTNVTNTDINGPFLTKPDLKCFDNKVTGNVGNHGKTTYNLACHFSSHYFVQVGSSFLDPCLMSAYTSKDGPIAHSTLVIGGAAGLRKAGTGKAMIILHLLSGRSVPGFGSVWELLTLAECPKVLAANEVQALRNDPEIKAAKLL